MLRKCCVPGCDSNYAKNAYTTVFRFPKDETLKLKWIRAIHRDGFQPNEQSAVCANHFDKKFILKEDGGRKKAGLKKDAYPTIFANQPKYMSADAPVIRKSAEIRNIQKRVNMKLIEKKELKSKEL